MLRLPTERLVIALCPGSVGIVRKPTGWRRRKNPQTALSIATGAEGWQAALDALAGWLDAEGVKKVPATVTVSSRWVRFALAPWSAAVGNEVEELSLARACLESAYGDLTGWTVALDSGRYGQSRIVCAVETAFLDRLRAILREREIACHGIGPYGMSALRAGRSLLSGPAGLLAVAESGTVVLAAARQGRWHSLRSVRSELSPATLVQLLARETLLQGLAETPALGAVVPGMGPAEMPNVTLLRPERSSSLPAECMAIDAASAARPSIDFAPGTWSAGRIAGLLGFVAALGIVAASGWDYLQLRQQQETWQSDWQRLRRVDAQPRATSTPEERERLKAELRFANRIIEKLDAPWDTLFGAVESAFNEQVTLLAVEPDTERREVRLVAEAKDMAAMLDYVRQVRLSAALKDAYLVDHHINQQDPQRPVRFSVAAQWVAPLPVEPPPSYAATNASGAKESKP